jgi:uncharacterized membrane protein YfcA
MAFLFHVLAAFAAGALGAMGLGGGGILVIYLTLALAAPQLQAQGINLLFFLPCAVISLVVNGKRGLVRWKHAAWICAGGLPATLLGIWLAGHLHTKWLGWSFAGVLILMGLKELFCRPRQENQRPPSPATPAAE